MSLIRKDLTFGVYTLERSARQLRRGTEPIVIPPKAFDLLLFLAERPGRPLLKDEIMAAVWEGSIVEESNLSQNIFLLRKALAPDGPAIIKTLPGRGTSSPRRSSRNRSPSRWHPPLRSLPPPRHSFRLASSTSKTKRWRNGFRSGKNPGALRRPAR